MTQAERYLAELLRQHPDLDAETVAALERVAALSQMKSQRDMGFGAVRKVAADAGLSDEDLQSVDDVVAADVERSETAIASFSSALESLTGIAVFRVRKAVARATTLDEAIELAKEQGVTDEQILQAQESIDLTEFDKSVELERLKAKASAMVAEYREAMDKVGANSQGVSFLLNDDETDYRIVFDLGDGTIQELNKDRVDLSPTSGRERRNPISGEFERVPMPGLPDVEQPYHLDPSYRISIDVDEYFAMIRWLDPSVEARLEDDEKLAAMFYETDFGINRKAGLVKPEQLGRVFEQFGGEPGQVEVGAKYASGDEVALFWGRSPEYVASIQQLMVQGNILDKSDIAKWGEWGMSEEAAIVPQMVAADKRGLSIRQWLEVRADDPIPDPTPTGFTVPVEQLPDYATLSQDLKQTFRARLGREPEPYEMGDLIRQMEQDHYSDYQEQVEGARLEWQARFDAAQSGEEQETGTIQTVDPFARFKEAFDTKYGPEVERNEAVAQNRNDVGSLMGRLAGIERTI